MYQRRWFYGADLGQWKKMVAHGDYHAPFFMFPNMNYYLKGPDIIGAPRLFGDFGRILPQKPGVVQ